MKRLQILITSLLCVIGFSACQQEEIVQSPEFTVYDSNEAVVFTMAGGEQYEYSASYFQQSVSASKENEITAGEQYTVNSNCAWRIVSAEAEYDWIKPFPDHGEDEGRFTFLIDRNNDQENGREAYFKIILNDGQNDRELAGMFIIKQDKCVDFLKASPATIQVYKEGAKKQSITITSNISWTYELVPDANYGTETLDWIKPLNTEEPLEKISTLQFQIEPNKQTIRGAILNINSESHPELNKVIPIIQYGVEVEAVGFPVEWETATGDFPNWVGSATLDPKTGAGSIKYVYGRTEFLDDPETKLDISGSNPRVTGAWPGDYWEFKASSPVSAGALIKLAFTGRVSGTGHKYWRLEYRDGSEWKIAGTPMTVELSDPAETVTYTHALENANHVISAVVKYQNTTDEVVFRFICAANYKADGSGRLPNPNGGTVRLDRDEGEEEPSISCVAAGYEDLTPSNIVVEGVKDNLITFEGSNVVPFTFKVTSDADFTVVADQSWILVENGSGFAGETKEVTVSCLESELSTSRRGMVEVKSGITKYPINVVQSSAGQELAPFISVVGGNRFELDNTAGEGKIEVQANVDFEMEFVETVDWITPIQTKALVEKTAVPFTYTANNGPQRTAQVRFFNKEENIETVVTIIQAKYTLILAKWNLGEETMGSYTEFFSTAPGDVSKAEGFADAYLPAQLGDGKIQYWSIDKTVIDTKSNFARVIGETGEPYVFGAWPGDYWYISGKTDTEITAGSSVRVYFVERASGTGVKYWLVEYLDGETWKPAMTTKTVDIDGQGTITYNVELKNTAEFPIDIIINPTVATKEIVIRSTCVANAQASGKGALAAPNGGTVRLKGAGKSPIIEVTEMK